MLEHPGINLIDINQKVINTFNIDWDQFRKEYETAGERTIT